MSHSLSSDESAHVRHSHSLLNDKSARVNVVQLVKNIKTDGVRMANDVKSLGIAEVKPMAKNAGIGGGMLGAAGYLGANAASLLFLAGAFAFSLIFNKGLNWTVLPSLVLGFICMAVVLLVITAILALIGQKKLKKVGKPEQTINEAKQSIDTLKASVKRGNDTVTANQLARADLAEVKKQAKDLEKSEF